LEPVHEDRFVGDCVGQSGGWIAVAECPSDQGCGIHEGRPSIVGGRVVGVEGVANQADLFLGDEDRIRDVEEFGQRRSGDWIAARPQGCQVDS